MIYRDAARLRDYLKLLELQMSQHSSVGGLETPFVRTGGEVKFVKEWETSGVRSRNFDGKWTPDKKARKVLAQVLWSLAVSFGHLHTAYRVFSKIRMVKVTPDGFLGGRGYIKSAKEIRGELASAIEILSDVTDTIHDDVEGPHWKELLDDNGGSGIDRDTEELIDEAEEVLENPEKVTDIVDNSSVADDVSDDLESFSSGPSQSEVTACRSCQRRIAAALATDFLRDGRRP